MSGSQKVLRVFGVFELLIAAYYVYLGFAGEGFAALVSAARCATPSSRRCLRRPCRIASTTLRCLRAESTRATPMRGTPPTAPRSCWGVLLSNG